MQKVNWLVVGIISIVIILLLFGGGMMMGGWGYRGWSMMGPGGMVGPGGMLNNWGYSSSPSALGWIGMIFMWLIPVGLIVLAAFGIVWLVRNAGNSKPPPSQSPCPNCARGIQADWQNCPYCGTALK